MQIGIFAKTFAGSNARHVLQAVHNAGYDVAQFNFACVGLLSMPDEIPPSTIEAITSASFTTGVGLAAVSGTYNMAHPDPFVRDDGLRRLSHMIASAKDVGTRLITLCTGTRDPDDQWRNHLDNGSPDAWRDLTAGLEKALAMAEQHGVDLGIEPELGNVVASPDLARKLIGDMASRRLKIVLDPANLFEQAPAATIKSIIDHAIDLLADRIVMAHAKDRCADGSVCAAGAGVIDFVHFVGALHRAGFDGPLVTHGLNEAEAVPVATVLRRILAEAATA